ncbi:MAG: S9 family peptidase, partial [Terriglobia bacterium]
MNRIAKVILWLATISLVLAGQALAQEKRPLTFDDLIGFGRVSDPQVSPGGQRVAYVVDYYDKDTNARSSNLWVASLTSGDNRRLTRTEKRDRWPRWAPDGKTLGFLSNRSGSWQVWTIRADGGEAIQLTELPVDITAFEWSPTGEQLVFAADVYPDCEDLECTKKRDEEKAQSGVSAALYDRLLYRHWDAWWDGKRTHVFVRPAQGGEARDLTPGDWSVPAYLDGSQGFSLSPNGSELAFSRNTDANAAWSTNGDVWTVSTSGGEPNRLTTNPAWDGSPQYSPDGKSIAYLAMERAGFEADRTRLVLYERATGERRELTPEFPNSVSDFVWAPDSQSLYFISSVNARHPLHQVSLADGRIRKVVDGYNSAPTISPDGTTLVFTQQAMNRPAEVFRAGMRGGGAKPVSHINDEGLAELEMNPGESFTVEGAKGTPVQSWLLKPPGFDPAKKYPVVVLIHGGPQGTWGDQFHYRWNAQMFAAPGYVAVMPNPRGSPGWGQKFVDE